MFSRKQRSLRNRAPDLARLVWFEGTGGGFRQRFRQLAPVNTGLHKTVADAENWARLQSGDGTFRARPHSSAQPKRLTFGQEVPQSCELGAMRGHSDVYFPGPSKVVWRVTSVPSTVSRMVKATSALAGMAATSSGGTVTNSLNLRISPELTSKGGSPSEMS